jgi:hypothetical protein
MVIKSLSVKNIREIFVEKLKKSLKKIKKEKEH